MTKQFKSVSMMLFLLAMSAGPAVAATGSAPIEAPVVQQSETCTGVVNDAMGPVIGASVVVKGTTNGVITDFDGNFSLSNVKKGDIIQISYVGYVTQEIKWDGKPLNIELKEDSEMLDEVVVTGYGGKQLRTKVTNSIAKVNNDKLTTGVYSNPAQALSGAVSGLRVVTTSGNPGATPKITLRGGTNLDGSGTPLVIVDGQLRDSMSDINPDDIESMDVLKDAGATAIYGARASNGVILITTKQGKEGRAEINLKARYGMNFVNTTHDFLEAGEYLYWIRNAYAVAGSQASVRAPMGNLTGASALGTGNNIESAACQWNVMAYDPKWDYLLKQHGWKKMKDPVYEQMIANQGKWGIKSSNAWPTNIPASEYIIYKDISPADYNFNDPAITQDYNLSFNGGNDKGTYYAGLGYNKSEGIPVTSFYERYSFLFNGSYKINKWLKANSSFSYNRANWDSMPGSQGNEANYFGRILSVPGTARYEDEEGNAKLGPGTGDGNQTFQPDRWWEDNQSEKFTMIQSFEITPMKGLSIKGTANWYISESVSEYLTKDYQTNQAGTSWSRTRSAGASYSRQFAQTYNLVANYSTQIKKHGIEAMLGMEAFDRQSKAFSASGSGSPADDLLDLGLTSADKNKRNIDSSRSQYRIFSYFGRLNYSYDDKYLLSAVFRRDGYSSLRDNRWGFFPGVSAGWIFGKEKWAQENLPFLSFGKLRASFGLNGNASGIGPYDLQGSYLNYFSSSKVYANYNGNNGFLIGSLPNPGLKWEKTRTFEVGADLSFFENRLNFNFTYYNRLTQDKYAAFSLPSTTGFSSITNNNGEFRNQGIELELSGKVLDVAGFQWNMSGNITYNKNKVVKLPNNGNERNRQNGQQVYTGNGDELKWVGGYQEGYEPGVVVGYVADGIFQKDEEINKAYPAGKLNYTNWLGHYLYTPEAYDKLSDAEKVNAYRISPGDVKWRDINGDGNIDTYDQADLGNSIPHWTGGFTSTMTWKGFRLYAAFDFALGFTNYDTTLPWYLGCGQGTYNATTEVYDTWTPENRGAKYPRYVYADMQGPDNYFRNSSIFAYDGSYLAFREVSLSYSLPKSIISKFNCQKLELSVTGQNLGYLCAAKVAAPEVSRTGGTASGTGYPLPRTLLFGLNVTF